MWCVIICLTFALRALASHCGDDTSNFLFYEIPYKFNVGDVVTLEVFGGTLDFCCFGFAGGTFDSPGDRLHVRLIDEGVYFENHNGDYWDTNRYTFQSYSYYGYSHMKHSFYVVQNMNTSDDKSYRMFRYMQRFHSPYDFVSTYEEVFDIKTLRYFYMNPGCAKFYRLYSTVKGDRKDFLPIYK